MLWGHPLFWLILALAATSVVLGRVPSPTTELARAHSDATYAAAMKEVQTPLRSVLVSTLSGDSIRVVDRSPLINATGIVAHCTPDWCGFEGVDRYPTQYNITRGQFVGATAVSVSFEPFEWPHYVEWGVQLFIVLSIATVVMQFLFNMCVSLENLRRGSGSKFTADQVAASQKACARFNTAIFTDCDANIHLNCHFVQYEAATKTIRVYKSDSDAAFVYVETTAADPEYKPPPKFDPAASNVTQLTLADGAWIFTNGERYTILDNAIAFYWQNNQFLTVCDPVTCAAGRIFKRQ